MQRYSVKQLADLYSVTIHTVGNWIRSGKLAAVDVSNGNGQRPHWRVTEEALVEFERSRSTVPPVKKKSRKSYQEIYPER